MQSSSLLFPVALISAERRGDLSEDVYRLKPANSPDISVELVVTRLDTPNSLNGSGLAIANPPWGLEEELAIVVLVDLGMRAKSLWERACSR